MSGPSTSPPLQVQLLCPTHEIDAFICVLVTLRPLPLRIVHIGRATPTPPWILVQKPLDAPFPMLLPQLTRTQLVVGYKAAHQVPLSTPRNGTAQETARSSF